MSQVYTSIIGSVFVYIFFLGSIDLSVFQNLHCVEKSSMMHRNVSIHFLFIYLLVYFFIYLFNICLFDGFYSTKKTGFRIFSNTFRSVSSPIDNDVCSRS